jgi:hypothetical protein
MAGAVALTYVPRGFVHLLALLRRLATGLALPQRMRSHFRIAVLSAGCRSNLACGVEVQGGNAEADKQVGPRGLRVLIFVRHVCDG